MGTSKLSPKIRWLLLAVAAVIAAVGFYAYYSRLTQTRRDYAVNNAFATLTVAADELSARLSNWGTVVQRARTSSGPDPEEFVNYLQVLVPGLKECGPRTKNGVATEGRKEGAENTGIVTRLSLQGSPAAGWTLQFRAVESKNPAAPSNFCAATTLNDLLRPMLVDANEVFENILLAQEDGEILYQDARSDSRLMRLDSLIASAAPPKPADPPAKTGTGANPVPAGKSVSDKFSQSSDYTQVHEVHLAGEDYLVYVQPAPVSYFGTSGNAFNKLLLVGQLRKTKLEERTAKLPLNSLAWALLLLSLSFSVAWTFSSLPGRPQLMPMRNIDVIRVALVALVSVAAMSIGVVHAYTSLSFDMDAVDEDLESLAGRLNLNVQEELARFAHVLQAMTASTTFKDAFDWNGKLRLQNANRMNSDTEEKIESCCILKSILQGPPAENQHAAAQLAVAPLSIGWKDSNREEIAAKAYSFPFFDYVLWSDTHGRQIAKFSIRRDVTPPTRARGFQWYLDTLSGRLFQMSLTPGQQRLLGCSSARLLVEPLHSPNTGEYLTVIAAPFAAAKDNAENPPSIAGVCNPKPISSYNGAGLILARLASVNSPIFPPGYGFVIFDKTGRVLYSSRPSPPKPHENFFRDTQNDPLVLTSAALKQQASVTVPYRGNPTRLHITPFSSLENASWTIVTFHDLAENRQAQVDTLGKSLLLMIPQAALLVLLSLWGWRRLGTSMAGDLWPRRELDGKYLMLVLLMTGASAYLGLVTLFASNNAIYFGMLILPPAAAMASIALLIGRTWFAGVLISPFLIGAVFNLFHRSGHWRPSDFALALIGVILLVAVWQFEAAAKRCHRVLSFLPDLGLAMKQRFRSLVSAHRPNAGTELGLPPSGGDAVATLSHNRPSNPGRWIYPYTAAIAIGFLALSVIPALATYRLAYDSTRLGKTMGDLVELSRRLEGRESSAQEYYRKIDLSTGSQESQRFVADRLSVTLDRYDLSLTSREAPRQILTQANASLEELDRLLGRLGVSSVAAHTKSTPGFATPNPGVLQFAYAPGSVGMDLDTAPGNPVPSRHVASRLVSLANMRCELWGFLLLLVGASYIAILSTVRFLFLLSFDCPKALRAMNIADLAAQTQNLILLGLASTGKSRRLRADKSLGYLDMRSILRGNDFRYVELPPGPVVIDHFEIGWSPGKSDEIRLELLEWLLYEERRTVVLFCVHDPAAVERERNRRRGVPGTPPDSPETAIAIGRWTRIWRSFPQLAIEAAEIPKPEGDAELEWTNRIYASCTRAQRAALFHLITEGWINPKNCQAAGELARRGLLVMSPAPDLPPSLQWMKRHIRRVVPPEDIDFWKTAGGSFSPLSVVMWTLGISVIVLLVFVGRDYVHYSAGLVATVMTALGAMWKVYSDIRPRVARAEAKEGDVRV